MAIMRGGGPADEGSLPVARASASHTAVVGFPTAALVAEQREHGEDAAVVALGFLQAELGEDLLHVALDGARREAQPPGEGAVRGPGGVYCPTVALVVAVGEALPRAAASGQKCHDVRA